MGIYFNSLLFVAAMAEQQPGGRARGRARGRGRGQQQGQTEIRPGEERTVPQTQPRPPPGFQQQPQGARPRQMEARPPQQQQQQQVGDIWFLLVIQLVCSQMFCLKTVCR